MKERNGEIWKINRWKVRLLFVECSEKDYLRRHLKLNMNVEKQIKNNGVEKIAWERGNRPGESSGIYTHILACRIRIHSIKGGSGMHGKSLQSCLTLQPYGL